MGTTYGIDGSRGGWIAVRQAPDSGEVSWQRVLQLTALLEHRPRPDIIAVDVPIGLPDAGARACDVEARKRLGPRRNSVFAAPIRPLLDAGGHGDASEGKRIPARIWSIVPRILEVDELLRQDPALRPIVHEIHPELSFAVMNANAPMPHAKKSAEGREERRVLLHSAFGDVIDRALAARRSLRCAVDDILDAFAALWTAGRIARGEAIMIPADAPVDAFGLRMAIEA
jgi:predicted RNase H-like nuclease